MKKVGYKARQWHKECFKCCSCKSIIGYDSFVPSGSNIYCSNCYENSFSAKCTGCGKPIISGGVTYHDQPWHTKCFTCTHCKKSLAGTGFTSRQDKPYCAQCVKILFSKQCVACTQPITGNIS